MTLDDVRPEVAQFAMLIEEQLQQNDGKRGWRDCDCFWLLAKLMEEVGEVGQLLAAAYTCEGGDQFWPMPGIAEELGDVGAVAMMLADVLGVLDSQERQ